MASEIEPTAIETYTKNFNFEPRGDIAQIKIEDIPNFDLLCAGFPCQSFSNVGNRKGLADPRGALIYQVVRLLKGCQPRAFLLENVKGLLSHDKGRTFRTIVEELEYCGYSVKYSILEAKDYGVPQMRKRVFIVGVRNDLNIPFYFPEPTGCDISLSSILGGETERDYAFTVRIGGRHSGIDNAFNWDCYMVNGRPKFISPQECLQLQGFPKDFYLAGNKDMQYKQVGNAVPTVVVREIGKKLVELGII